MTNPSNLYFLVIGILQMIPAISPTGEVPVMFLPLILIIVINMVRDYVEDQKRQQADIKENEKIATKLLGSGMVSEIQ